MSVSGSVRIEGRGAVTVVSIDRPGARNAVDRKTAEALSEAFRAFEADAESAVAVLAGEGGTFCAGADLKAASTRSDDANRVAADGDGPMGPSRMALSKPVIAAIDGYAVAGGLELAVWCDLRVMEEDAVMGVFCRRWGVPLIDGGTVRLPRLIGMGRALDLILTGRAVGAAEALAMGLVTRVVKKGEARSAAIALAEQISRFPQACMRADRASAYAQWELPMERAIAVELAGGVDALEKEGVEGAGRFARGEGRGGVGT